MVRQINKRKMKRRLYLVLGFIIGIGITSLNAQDIKSALEGNISYVSSQNVYVKFASTHGLQKGDTLYISKGNKNIPALVIQQLSSISCVSTALTGIDFAIGDRIIGKPQKMDNFDSEEQEKGLALLPKTNEIKTNEDVATSQNTGNFEQDIWGKIKVSAYSNSSNNFNNDNQRFRYTFNLKANHISNSAVSVESYLAFSHRIYDGTSVPSDISDLKIYNLAIRYNLGEYTRFWLGRKINSKIANVGAIDGLQAETSLKNFTLGAVVGARPNYTDYRFDFNLFEFGLYAAHKYSGQSGIMENTFSIFEQRNGGNTDRRFMYIQHANSLVKNINLFASFEIDMYKLENGLPINTLSLTSAYLSLRYRFSSKFNATASYDARKNVIYYETFQNLADSILESSTRQGYRIRLNYRPMRKLSVGASASYRNRPEDSRPTKNANAYLRYAQLPFFNASLSITANLLQTSYLDGFIYGARFDKYLLEGKLNLGLNYRHVNYDFVNSSTPLNQNIAELNLNVQIVKNLSISASYEGVFEKDNQYNRIYLNLIKRF